jgi:hypothetical protein
MAATLAVAVAVWGLIESRQAPRTTGSPAIVLAAPDSSQLEAGESWNGDALQRLILDDLGDAWRVEARAASSARPADASIVRTRLWRDARGQLRAAVSLP